MPNSLLHRAVVGLTGVSVRHRRFVLAGWVLFVVGCVAAGGIVGTRALTDAQKGSGSSARGLETLLRAGMTEPATESVLVEGSDRADVLRVVTALQQRLRTVHAAAHVRGPASNPALLAPDGQAALIELDLTGDASRSVVGVQREVATVGRTNPSVKLFEVGDGTVSRAIGNGVSNDFRRAELFALPLTLIILVLVFGAVVAALVPLLLGLTSVAAAIGAVGAMSHLIPTTSTASSAILLIGLAVGVDYSLFYMRREREERRGGRAPLAALEAATATVGHAVVVSGMSVIVAMAGLLLTGSAVFTAIAIGTMLVVATAVLGSVTVLPAVLAMLGDRVYRGRLWRRRMDSAERRGSAWRTLADAVVARPRIALLTVVLVLGSLALGVLQLHTSDAGLSDLPPGSPVLSAQRVIERAFPGGSSMAQIVVSNARSRFSGPRERTKLEALGGQAIGDIAASGTSGLSLSRDEHVAELTVPLPGNGTDGRTIGALAVLRSRVLPAGRRVFAGARVDLTGAAAAGDDFTGLMRSRAPWVIGFVLALGFMLLLAAFRSAAIAAAVLALNLLSVGAAFGVLVQIFQHHWAQGALGFTSNGAVVSWLPLFAFAVLFGLSMDYTVLVVARILEGVRRGLPARQAAAEGVAATAGVVSSAAIVMVAVFSVFATLSALEFKQTGVGLAAAILIDATLVRGIALPAVITLLADRSWGRVRGPASTIRPAADAVSTGV